MAPVAGKDVKLPMETKTYAMGCREWLIYLSLIWPPLGLILLFTVPTKLSISPDGTMRLLAVCRTTMTIALSEDVASMALVESGGCSVGDCTCHKYAIELYFTDAFLKRWAGSRAEEMKTRPHPVGGLDAEELASDLGLAGVETA